MSPESVPTSPYETMGFSDLAHDPIAGPVLERCALEVLQTDDIEYFQKNFSGELDAEGYLLKKDGSASNTKPSQNIGSGFMDKVVEKTKSALR